jgi:hypothetical protein
LETGSAQKQLGGILSKHKWLSICGFGFPRQTAREKFYKLLVISACMILYINALISHLSRERPHGISPSGRFLLPIFPAAPSKTGCSVLNSKDLLGPHPLPPVNKAARFVLLTCKLFLFDLGNLPLSIAALPFSPAKSRGRIFT